MIKVHNLKPSGGLEHEIVIESDEKVTIKFMETTNGDILSFVFKGIGSEMKDWHEPVAMFSSRSKSKEWIVKN